MYIYQSIRDFVYALPPNGYSFFSTCRPLTAEIITAYHAFDICGVILVCGSLICHPLLLLEQYPGLFVGGAITDSLFLFWASRADMLLLCYVLTIEIVVAGMATGGAAPQRGTAAAAAANLRRRRTAGGGAAGNASGTMLQFYTDDAPGLKISPNVVLVMSIGFIAFVAILHVMGKLYFVRKE
ncbi:protein transport protein Sec61 subunit beta [Sesamum angolense]|uniref:Protein transport protein Sec61 subunit beta n=1 Tax=Sesamum angolense TaxID=2727404 RepID=A0AAE1XGY8_9LAMI|nr:protein transport protein Sec61 subunit beta [Sesamum angolense]